MARVFYVKGDNAAEAHMNVVKTLRKNKLYSHNLLYRTFDGIRIPTLLKTGNDREHADDAGIDFLLSDEIFGIDPATDFATSPRQEQDNLIPLPDKETIEAINAATPEGDIEGRIYASTEQDVENDVLSAWSLIGKYEQPAIAVYRNERFNKTDRYEYAFKNPSKKRGALVAVFTVGWKYPESKN